MTDHQEAELHEQVVTDIAQKEPILPNIISIVLHPLLMTLYGMCLLIMYTDFRFLISGQTLRFLSIIFIISAVMPASCMFMLKQLGFISNYSLTKRSERFLPYIIGVVAHIGLFYIFFQSGLYTWFLAILLSPVIILIIGIVITLYWKISVHMLSIGCLIGNLMSICYNVKGLNLYVLFIILFILAGIVGVSRLILRRHTPAQVYAGFIVGFAIAYACIWIGANFAFLYIRYLTL